MMNGKRLDLRLRKCGAELENRESRLAENSRRLEAVLSSMIEGVLAVDADGLVKAANGAARKMLALTPSELINRKLVEIARNPAAW